MRDEDKVCSCGHKESVHTGIGRACNQVCTCLRFTEPVCAMCKHTKHEHSGVEQACFIQCGCPHFYVTHWPVDIQGPVADSVNHPTHYTNHPSGVDCIQITEHMNFCLGNAMKYIWRAGLKDAVDPVQDLEKARWYISREIERHAKATYTT